MDSKFSVNVRGNFAQFGVGHGFIGLVLEIECALAFEIVTDETVKDYRRAIFKGFEVKQDFARLDGFAQQKNDVVADGGLLPAADGREKCDLVTCRQRGAPCGVFLVYRGGDGRAKFSEAREAARVTLV